MASYLLNQLQGMPLFTIETFMYALVGGILPAVFWLWFWMHESNNHKEPKDIIFLAFVIGMCGVFLSVYLICKKEIYQPYTYGL
jgi:RsiW-degrading membrane proteinase PrsW (M82 family)